ncbi:unnamed protein product [Tuber aestivum]|uniref:Rieske domain-containing protein n=1 Tax=Tuber aestivum TaxID=59557 RepID=A0A292Q086_9PEZI|nr:unnamed protein product [Tuber aestivum]
MSGIKPKSKHSPKAITRLRDKLPTGPSAEGTGSIEIAVSEQSVSPANWRSSDEHFQLEKSAIFSKVLPDNSQNNPSWIYVTHSSRFEKVGDWVSFEITDLPFFIVLGKDNQLRAFDNVCCRYHGWPYNVQGALIKAPWFEGVEGFDKERNGLFEIHGRTTKEGLVFVNLDVSRSAVAHPEDKLNAAAAAAAAALHGGIKTRWVDGWAREGRFNWKITPNPGRRAATNWFKIICLNTL